VTQPDDYAITFTAHEQAQLLPVARDPAPLAVTAEQ